MRNIYNTARQVGEKPGEMHGLFCYHALGICTPKAPEAQVTFIVRKLLTLTI